MNWSLPRAMNRREFLALSTAGVSLLSGCQSRDNVGATTSTVSRSSVATPTSTEVPTAQPTKREKTTESPEPESTESVTENESTPEGRITNFVDVDGIYLTVEGERLFLCGGNNAQLRKYSGREQQSWIDEWTRIAPGLNMVRTRAYGAGAENDWKPLQPLRGEWSEEAFRGLDELIFRCGEAGIRLVLPLTDWVSPLGMAQYVAWSDTASSKEEFYTDENTTNWFKDHIRTVLTRANPYTGLEYRNDPRIAVWELANEPQPTSNSDDLVAWTGDISAFIKSLDPNHLVSTGMDRDVAIDVPEWYKAAHDHPTIDLYSTHVWADPCHADIGIDGGVEWIANHARVAHEELEMPAYVGEFGWCAPDSPDREGSAALENRANAIREWFEQIDESEMAGGLVWDLRRKEAYTLGWNDYAVYPQDMTAARIIGDASERFAEKSEANA